MKQQTENIVDGYLRRLNSEKHMKMNKSKKKKVKATDLVVGMKFKHKKTGDIAEVISIGTPTGFRMTTEVRVRSTYVDFVFRSPSSYEDCFRNWYVEESNE